MLNRVENVLRLVGNELIKLRSSGPIIGCWSGPAQFKAHADLVAHKMLAEGLRNICGNIPIISEEDRMSQSLGRSSQYWLIDPIDGTASFAGGYDGFVTQVALMENDFPKLAAVHAPALNLMYLSVKGQGATVNGRNCRVSSDPDRRILIDNYPQPRGVAAAAMCSLNLEGYIESGSIGLKICRVADGKADLFFKDIIIRDWDIAPGYLILTEAGGAITGLNGKPFRFKGAFEKIGVLASRSNDLISTTATWLRSIHTT